MVEVRSSPDAPLDKPQTILIPAGDPNEAHEELKGVLQVFLQYARRENVEGRLRSRPLSETITCAETAYLWLCQVAGDDVLLDF